MGDVFSSIITNTNFSHDSINKTITLLNNISWADDLGYSTFNYIGLPANYTFNGNNKTISISGLTGFKGLFTSSASTEDETVTIKNLGILGGTTDINGAFIVRSHQKYFTVDRCYATGAISAGTGGAGSGGIAGSASGKNGKCTISRCYTTGEISGEDAGGIVADYAGEDNGECIVINCYSLGIISGDESGGICGGFASGNGTNGTCTITNCYSIGSATGTNAGGICGRKEATASGIVTVTNCYSNPTRTTYSSGSDTITYNETSFDYIDGFATHLALVGTIATLPSSIFFLQSGGYPVFEYNLPLNQKPDGTHLLLIDSSKVNDLATQLKILRFLSYMQNLRDKLAEAKKSFGSYRVDWDCAYKNGILYPTWVLGYDPIPNFYLFGLQAKQAINNMEYEKNMRRKLYTNNV